MAPPSLAGPADRHEVVEQPPELALDVDVAVRAPDQPELAVGREPGPDAAPREVERDRDAGMRDTKASQTRPCPGSFLAMSRVYSPKSASATADAQLVGHLGLAARRRDRREVLAGRVAVGVRRR